VRIAAAGALQLLAALLQCLSCFPLQFAQAAMDADMGQLPHASVGYTPPRLLYQPSAAAGPKSLTPLVMAACIYALLMHGAPVDAFSASVYWDTSCSNLIGSASNLPNDKCYSYSNAYDARVQCDPNGMVTKAAFYAAGTGCTIVEKSGSGRGDGVTCIALRGTGGDVGVRIDCSAPGADPVDSSSLSTATIIIIAAGCIVGVAILGGIGHRYCRQREAEDRSMQSKSMALVPPHPQEPYHHLVPGQGANRV
jgi:hypothetical protein